MTDLMHYAFIDESGTVGVQTGTHFLVIAVVCGDNIRNIELPVQRSLKKYGTSLSSGEMKANSSREAVVLRLLQDLINEDIHIIAVSVNQKTFKNKLQDNEDIYRKAVSRAIYHLVKRWSRIQICLDRRYTNNRLRFNLEKHIREEISELPQKIVLIQQLNSQSNKGLQVADFIAWSFYQKYENNDARFVDILAEKIILDEVFTEKEWRNKLKKR
jgi:hypothetical protein